LTVFESSYLSSITNPLKHTSTRKYLEFTALCLLAVALIWWFGRKLDWVEVRAAVSKADWVLLSISVLVISSVYLFRAYRWGTLLAPLCPARIADLFAATSIGFGAVFLVGRAGEVVRPVVLPMRDPRIRPSASFVTILVERIYDMMAVILIFAINLLWFRPPTDSAIDISKVRFAGALLLGLAIVGVVGLIWYRKRSEKLIEIWQRLFRGRWFMPDRVNRAFVSLLEQLARALRVLVDAKELAITVGWTSVVWVGIVLANFLVLRAFGLPFGIKETLFILGWSLVGSLVPTPGGAAGAFHAATAAGLLVLGVTRETAAAVSIVMHLVDFGPALLIGFFYFIRGDINVSRLRSLSSPEALEQAVEQVEAPRESSPEVDVAPGDVENSYIRS
jgi:uncharacterized protein (TIRG00374 family)